MESEKKGVAWMDHPSNNPESLLRESIVNAIIEKSTFNNVTGKTIVDYSREIEYYILHGEMMSQPKSPKGDWT